MSLSSIIGQASRGADLYFVFRFLRLLTMDYKKTDAFKFGIIDSKGKALRKSADLESIKEKASYTMLHRMVFKIRRLMEKVPGGRFVNYAAALFLLKEQKDVRIWTDDIYMKTKLLEFLETDWEADAKFLKEEVDNMDKKSFKSFLTENQDIEESQELQAMMALDDAGIEAVIDKKGQIVIDKKDKKKAEKALKKSFKKGGVPEIQYEEVEKRWTGGKLPPHLAKFFDKDGNLKKDAAARVAKGREKINWIDVTPKGYGPKEEVEIDEVVGDTRSTGTGGYDLYHKDFSAAMQHAYKHAKKKGFIVDPEEIDDKVATGPKKPSSGKTNRYILGTDKRKKVHIQVANLDNKRYELNMYIEGVEATRMPMSAPVVLDELLKSKDKSVIDAFYNENSLVGRILSSTGKSLEKVGVGAQTIAAWLNGKIAITAVSDVKSTESILRYMKNTIPKGNFDPKSYKKFFEEVEIDESTKEYAKSLDKIARDRQISILSKSDKATLLKIAEILAKEKKEEVKIDEDQGDEEHRELVQFKARWLMKQALKSGKRQNQAWWNKQARIAGFERGADAVKVLTTILDTQKEDVELDEAEIATSIGSGGTAGLDMGLTYKKKKEDVKKAKALRKQMVGESVQRTTFAGKDVFIVDSETYYNCRLGKKKYGRYEKYVGKGKVGQTIREYGLKYPRRPIILQNGESGPMLFLKYGRS